MIPFSKKILPNGLRVISHEDRSTPLVAVNIAYNVGSRNDPTHRTGFAHLFEHLMFGGSKHAPDFDGPLQEAGGDSNAFTNNDITNYYEVLPVENVETALWLEADRLAHLKLNQRNLNKEKKVVVEEFKETCLNQPYGDVWHHLSDLAYRHHPYRWPVIGLEPQHISDAKLEDVSAFFKQYYNPSNAVLVLAGNMGQEEAFTLAEKWFGHIPAVEKEPASIQQEPPQTERRFKHVEKGAPVPTLYMAFHMPDRLHADYYEYDLLSDLLALGKSSRMYQRFVKEEKLFTEIDVYLTGTNDPGLFVVEGRLAEKTTFEQAEKAVWEELMLTQTTLVPERELQKLKNRAESNLIFSEAGTMSIAQNLAYFELLGDAHHINGEGDRYQAITAEGLQRVAKEVFREENCSVLYYS